MNIRFWLLMTCLGCSLAAPAQADRRSGMWAHPMQAPTQREDIRSYRYDPRSPYGYYPRYQPNLPPRYQGQLPPRYYQRHWGERPSYWRDRHFEQRPPLIRDGRDYRMLQQHQDRRYRYERY